MSNTIYSNTGLGIDLSGDGVTLNTPDGPHVGANVLQNFPVLTSVTTTAGSTVVVGTLNSTPYTPFTIQFFSNSAADSSGYGQGKTYLGELTNVFTQGNMAFFTADLSVGIGPGELVTATATDSNGNTSEFSQDVVAAYSNPLLVTTTADSGTGSLRVAITYANANPGTSAITFDIPGTGVQTITPDSPLPAITVSVTIDGYSQPGAHANTLAQGDDAVILIEINGGLTGGGGFSFPTGDGLVLSGGNSTVRGLAIDGFSGGAAIHVNSPGGDTIAGDFLGIDPTGNVARPDQVGVQVQTNNNTIGGTTPADRDVVSANTFAEVYLLGEGAIRNTVEGDFVGTNAAGTASLSNPGGGDGVDVDNGAFANTIGGTTASARNVLSGNGASGVRIAAAGTGNNVVEGNLIGTDGSGTAEIGNGADGVAISSSAFNNTVGGTTTGAGNTIAYNALNGVDILAGAGNPILSNVIFGNHLLGIDLGGDGVTLNTPGGPHSGSDDLENFPVLSSAAITANSAVIIGTLDAQQGTVFTVQFYSDDVADPSGHGQGKTFLGELTNVVTNTDGFASFTAALSTVVQPGEFVTATATDPGGNTSEFSQDIQVPLGNPLVVTTTADSGLGSLRAAIAYSNANSVADTISFDIPGAGLQIIAPLTPLPTITNPVTIDGYTQPGAKPNDAGVNDDAILLIELSGASTVGAAADGLTIAAGNSTVRGLAIDGFVNGPTAGAAAIALNTNGDNLIEGDFIGTDASGTMSDGNITGVEIISGTGNTVGGTSAAARNIISGNEGSGVRVDLFNASGTLIQGNSIGTDASGRMSLGNAVAGVDLAGSSVMVSRNVISDNGQNGVVANDSEAIFGNRIVGNGNPLLAGGAFGAGIKVYGSNNTIGGTGAFQSNVISSNAADGVAIISVNPGVTGNENVVQGNDIGTEPGTVYNDEGNGGDGVSIETTGEGSGGINNVIGDAPSAVATGAGNVIAFNGRNGVNIYSDNGADNTGNAVLGNSIFENKLLGIDLGNDAVTPNGSHAGESGPNNWQATPIITSAIVDNNVDGASVLIAGTLDSVANTTYRIDFLQDVAADASTSREFLNFLGMRTVTTDATGHASFSADFFTHGPGVFTATATDPTGNTSEFCAATQPAAPSADLQLSISPVTPSPGLTNLPYGYTVTVTNAGPQDATNVVVKDLVGNGAVLFGVDTTGTISELSPTLDNISFAKLAAGASETLTFSDGVAFKPVHSRTRSRSRPIRLIPISRTTWPT